jgi:beta-glucanase (GH16 family)
MKKLLVFLSMLVLGTGAAYALPKPIDSLQQLGHMGLAWSDEFNGTVLDTVNAWSYDTIYPQPNAEQEHYKRACVEVSNGRLIIWSKLNTYGVQYASGKIDTHDKKIFTYGYFEAAIQGPIGTAGTNDQGLWSAVWLLGNSINHGVAWPTCGEMELYEQRTCTCVVTANAAQPVPAIAGDDEFIACCHYGDNGGASYHSCQHNYPSCLCGGFHKYGVYWDTNSVHYYFDDTLFWGPNFPIVNGTNFGTPSITLAANQVAFSSPFYWIINAAVGGAYQGQHITNTIFPTHMDLDYVRVYQRGIVPTGVVNGVKKQTLRSFALVNPSTAQLKVYDLKGKLVADYTNKVRQMKAGDNAIKTIPVSAMLARGAYIVRLFDNGNSLSQTLVSTK